MQTRKPKAFYQKRRTSRTVIRDLTFNKTDRSILIANAIDHFDTSIYGFLAPKMAPLFFPHHDPVVQLILAYSILCSSVITRPLGAWIFGMIAKHRGPIGGLSYSLMGVAIFTLCFGLLPTYEQVGCLAPSLLLAVRMIRGIFAAGESAIAKIYLVDHKEYDNAFRASYWYQATTMVGIVLASLFSTLISWRLCFIAGSSVGIYAVILRRRNCHSAERQNPENTNERLDADLRQHDKFAGFDLPVLKSLWQEKLNVLRVALTTGISHITYAIPFIVLNSLMPLISNITFETMMHINTFLLVFDTILVMVIGPFLKPYSTQAIMRTSLVMLCFSAPMIGFLSNASLIFVTFVRVWIVFWGVVFATPMNLYYKQLFGNNPNQYFFTGMANAFGASIIGKCTPALCFSLFHTTQMSASISLYILLAFVLGIVVMKERNKI